MYNRATYWGYFEGTNPAAPIDRFPETSRRRFLQPYEMPRFLAALSDSHPTFRDFILMCLLTGARRSNIQRMQWREINFERATWVIPETKNGLPHEVPLVDEAVVILDHRKRSETSQRVFRGSGKSGHYEGPKRAWEGLLKRAEIADLHIHDLRRTLGSWQAAAGASLPVIGGTLGHRSIHSTAIYARLSLDPIRESMAVATSAMLVHRAETDAIG